MSDAALAPYLERPMDAPEPDVLAAIRRGPISPSDALHIRDLDRLLDPAPLAQETGWCWLPDGVGYIAVRTAMPDVTGDMADWWFDWHPQAADRYRIWHPVAHIDNRVELPATRGAKGHWGTTHHPVEDVGTGVVHARIDFVPPSEVGFLSDALDDPRVGTIVCGYAGDDTRHVRHTVMAHVFLNDGDGVVLRSRFWLGSAMRPYLPAPLGALGAAALNRPAVRNRLMPRKLPQGLATHCAEEYANLGVLLPELYERFGPRAR